MKRISDETFNVVKDIEGLAEIISKDMQVEAQSVKERFSFFEKEVGRLFPSKSLDEVLYMINNIESIKELYSWNDSPYLFAMLEYKCLNPNK